MRSRWSDPEAREFVDRYGERFGRDLTLRTYTSRLIGAEPALVLHGGGNTSVKTSSRNAFGDTLEAIFVKASGADLATIEPEGHSGVELEPLLRLEGLDELPDEEMVRGIRARLLDYRAANPSIETLVHAFIRARYVDHTHAEAVLTLTNQAEGESLVREALGEDVLILDYIEPGFQLAKATARAIRARPDSTAAVWMRHGLITWGADARSAYERTVELVTRAEKFVADRARRPISTAGIDPATARRRWSEVAPILRGLLCGPSGDDDRPFRGVILKPLIEEEVLEFLAAKGGRELALTPPLTSDHLIRTKAYPLWVEGPPPQDPIRLRGLLSEAVEDYRREYQAYFDRYSGSMAAAAVPFDPSPRVVLLPGIGAACAGPTLTEAEICRDITEQTLRVKSRIASAGEYRGMGEADLFAMEFRGLQHAKLRKADRPLEGRIALVTGAAGAIGAGICRGLLEAGSLVAASDIAADRLEELTEALRCDFAGRVRAVPMDVADGASVARAFGAVAGEWGGIDLVVVNAGVALVSSLAEMRLEAFQRLERVNVEGTLLVLSEAARHFARQGIGGDVVLISTKNVFAPGAGFGAYSATKAAAHQLARIASLELSGLGVRVNMVAPDAVFGEGRFKSGLWAEVGPDRMKARGLDESGLEDYYRQRNLLRSRVTARHVANAVLFFATRQTPTTGATIPVDGGLPDSTPR
jgi:rhamnose utilization protein RhaD (predicted bifunctional aldolase and dehydrogenase)/NAD(P)-dependent dehydrogenase (short-subunit alcohol dehydrogenase family)